MTDMRAALKGLEAKVICEHDFKKTGLTLSAVFDPSVVSKVASHLIEAGYFLEDISVMEVTEGFLATYHYDSAHKPGRVAIRSLAADGIFVSIASVYQGAEWHERESSDFFGVEFVGNPNPVALLLAHDFDGPPPLRKKAEDLSPLRALGLFGEPDILDSAWEVLVRGPKPDSEEGVA